MPAGYWLPLLLSIGLLRNVCRPIWHVSIERRHTNRAGTGTAEQAVVTSRLPKYFGELILEQFVPRIKRHHLDARRVPLRKIAGRPTECREVKRQCLAASRSRAYQGSLRDSLAEPLQNADRRIDLER